MKRYLLVFTMLLTPYLLLAQGDIFQLNEEHPELINQYVVIKKDSLSTTDGFNKVLEWINISYNTPKEVIKAQLQDEYIRIEGYNSKITSQNVIGTMFIYEGKYSLTFEFKKNKIKMELTRLQVYNEPTKYSAGGWSDQFPSLALQTKKNGKPRKGIQQFQKGLQDSMNDLRLSLQSYVNNTNKSIVNKDEW